MSTKHVHRPSFCSFLGNKRIRIKGRRISIYTCRECGTRLRIVPSQQEFHDFLPAIPILLSLFAGLTLLYLGAKTLKDGLIAVGILLIAYLLTYAIAYRFTRFAVVPDGKEEKPEE